MSSLLITAGSAFLVVIAYLLWRFWPLILGVARKGDSSSKRLQRWNSYVVPFLPKLMEMDIAIGTGGTFTNGHTGEEHSIATWSLTPTLLPDVEYLALARPDGDTIEIKAIGSARAIRAIIEDSVVERVLWGHRTFLYVWPREIDLDEFAQQLHTVEGFKAEQGLELDASLDMPPASAPEPDSPEKS
ncbi:MAG: hypothetical protein ACE366_15965 [Bradymonadia bacterium]